LAELGDFGLFAEPVSLPVTSRSGSTFEIDDGDKVVYDNFETGQLHLNDVAAHANGMIWCATGRACRQVIGQAVFQMVFALVSPVGDRG
jgi:hypothetical protein